MTIEIGSPPRAVAESPRSATATPGGTKASPGHREFLVAHIADGSHTAFAELHTTCGPKVFAFVLGILRDRHQAEEVTQEVFLQLWQQASRFDPARGAALAWILHLAHARTVDRIRHQQASRLRDHSYATKGHVADIDTVADDVLRREQHTAVRAALQHLTALQRESILLVYYAGMTTAQISTHLGVNQPTIKTRVRDGLKKIATQLAAPLPDAIPAHRKAAVNPAG